MKASYKVFLTNFGYAVAEAVPTLQRAIEVSMSTGFETTIISNTYGNVVGSWSPLSGYRSLLD